MNAYPQSTSTLDLEYSPMLTGDLELEEPLSTYLGGDGLVPQPPVARVILCPCARCTDQRREEYAVAERSWERQWAEGVTRRDRDMIDLLDVLAKITVVLLVGGFLFICYHAYATGAVERMLSR